MEKFIKQFKHISITLRIKDEHSNVIDIIVDVTCMVFVLRTSYLQLHLKQ